MIRIECFTKGFVGVSITYTNMEEVLGRLALLGFAPARHGTLGWYETSSDTTLVITEDGTTRKVTGKWEMVITTPNPETNLTPPTFNFMTDLRIP